MNARRTSLPGGGGKPGDIEDIVQRLDALLRTVDEVPGGNASAPVRQDIVEAARRSLAALRERERLFGAGLFTDPAWTILLQLFVAGEEGREVKAGCVCAAAAVPDTVALRCIALLVSAKLVKRRPHGQDAEGTYLELTHTGQARLCDYFNRVTANEGGAAA